MRHDSTGVIDLQYENGDLESGRAKVWQPREQKALNALTNDRKIDRFRVHVCAS